MLLLVAFFAVATGASARTICAGGPHCPLGLQKAIDVARPGDTVRIAHGTFRGGIHINKSIRLAGVARSRTTIAEVVVLTVREPLEAISFLGIGSAGVNQEVIDEVTASNQSGAEAVATEGAELARAAGLESRPQVETGVPVWQTIVEAAEHLDAGLIVIGSHGRSGLGLVMLGSVAAAVSEHSKRSVLIVHNKA